MRLCDRDIIAALEEERIRIVPRPDDRVISGVSVDLRLGHRFRVFSSHTIAYIDLSGSREQVDQAVEKVMGDEVYISEDETFVLHPGELALGITLEAITLPDDLVGWLDGRSSLARLAGDGDRRDELRDADRAGAATLHAAGRCQVPRPKRSARQPDQRGSLGRPLIDSSCISTRLPSASCRARSGRGLNAVSNHSTRFSSTLGEILRTLLAG